MSSHTDTITADGVEGYPSLTALREAHSTLLEQRRAHGDTADLLATVERLVQRGVATGALLDGSEDRRAAQSLLNYWANILYRAGRGPLEATLVEFDPLLAPALPDELCPYLGLDAFSETSADRFFGRQELIDRMLDRLGKQRLLAVAGPSGSGKSSVVCAGVLPALRGGALPGSESWRYLATMVPGSAPLASLERVLCSETKESELKPKDEGRSAEGGGQRTEDRPANRDAPLVLVVDQFEEAFTLCEDAGNRQAFIEQLLALASAPEQPHRFILTMRSDFETFVARIPALQPVFERGRVQVTPLSAAELREAIEAPAAQVGLKFEQGVVDLLLQDILGEPAGLPLLQFTLLKLWEQRERNRATRATYERVGGGRLALARSADAFYQGLIPEEQVTARRILLRMVRPGEGLEITSSRVRRSALMQGGEDPGRVERVLEKLVDARLVRLTTGETFDDDQVEVAHEALVRNWPTLVDWLEEEKAAIATRRRLESRATEWVRLGSGKTGLLDEVEWREAERWLQSAEAHYLGYEAAVPVFITASRAATERAAHEQEATRQRELEQAHALADAQRRLAEAQARTARWLQRALGALIMLLVIALLAAAYAFFQRNIAQTAEARALDDANARATAQIRALQEAATARAAQAVAQTAVAEADRQRETVDVQRLAFAARSQFETAPETSLLLAYEAARREANPITEQTLRDAIDHYPATVRVLQGHRSLISSAVFSPDGQRILTASWDNTARVWNLNGRQLATLQGHMDILTSAVFSPDGQRILTASADKTARVWNLRGKELTILQGHTDYVSSAMFSPDGQRILTASRDKTARVWDLSGKLLATLQGHTDIVSSAVFSPDGQRILTASRDKTAQIWDLSGKPLTMLQGHTDWVTSAVFSPNGQRILSTSQDRTARVWSLGGKLLVTLQGHIDFVTSAVFSSDGQRVLTISRDRTARVWSLRSKPLATLQGHTDWVSSVVFSPDGQRILTASYDGTARIWNLSGKELAILQERTAEVSSAVFSPDGQRILTASYDGIARIWNLSGKELATLQGSGAIIFSAVFSSDGQRILTASADNTARIWDLSGKPLVTLRGHTAVVFSAVFSPDGQHILTASADNTARIWDLSGKPLVTLRGHTDFVTSGVFSPDGQHILTASRDRTARVWNVSGEELTILLGHTDYVFSAVFSPDGQRILTASADNTARIWDLSGKQLAILQGHTAEVSSAVFSPDGQRILTGSYDRTAQQYLMNIRELLTVAACRVPRGLSEEEIKRFDVGTPRFDFTRRQCPPALGR